MYRPDHYYRYDELTEYVDALPARFGSLVRVESIGQSGEGREIWVVTISADDRSKPAYWVDGNTHATEVTASAACLHTIETLLSRAGEPEISDLLEHVTFYIAPRINPDGAEYFFETGRYVRSAPRAYPDEHAISTFIEEDVDGDGEILQMRWRDPHGAWKVSEKDGRAMVPRSPWDTTGPFYHVTSEGRFTDDAMKRGNLPIENVNLNMLDFNRNYPHAWRPEHEQKGAGEFPLSEPETRAVVEFLFEHKNICGVLTHHTFSGVLLRPFTDRHDHDMPKFDLQTYELIGDRCEEVTGYPCVSVFHDFKYDPVKSEGGVFDDWVYEHYGVHAYTMELWDPLQRAGVDMSDGFLRPWLHPTEEDELRLLAWNDDALAGEAVVPWKTVEHAQLGTVEVGGWRWQFARRNPPTQFLEETSLKGVEFALIHAKALPRPELSVEVTSVDTNTKRVDVTLRNAGFLPTYVTQHAIKHSLAKEPRVEFECSPGLSIVDGESIVRCAHLEGIWHQTLPRTLGGTTAGKTRADQLVLSWMVQGTGAATVTWYGDRIGLVMERFEVA